MAKRDAGPARPAGDTTTTTNPTTTASADAIEQSVVAFAQQLGRIAGTLQAKAEGWMVREDVKGQIASVRDGAADLLDQLSAAASRASAVVKTKAPANHAPTPPAKKAGKSPVKSAEKKPPAGGAAPAASKRRSGGAVDAPGKKHRKPAANPDAHLASSQAAKMRAAMPMEKTTRRRGRG
jgi:hypothetical protein